MSRCRLPLFALCCLALLLNPGQGAGQETTAPTTLRVLVPQRRALVLVDGKPAPVTSGVIRVFLAPALGEGKKEYEITAAWETNNYTRFFRTLKVAAKPGGTVIADLRKPDPTNPDRIEIRYVPTPDDVVERMCKLARVGADDVVFDLGCGDGRIVISAVADFNAKRGVGIDLSAERIRESIANARKRDISDKVEFRKGDVLKIDDLSSATVVMLYMGTDVNLRLRPILQKTLKPGARIVSHRFGMGDWKPDHSEIFEAADGEEYTIHLWTIRKKAETLDGSGHQ
jgi:uncharacterized protein (TIGR03000 family)